MYPYQTLNLNNQPAPLFGDVTKSEPYFLDLSFHNKNLDNLDLTDQESFQEYIDQEMRRQYTWGFSGYLEYRSTLLGHLPQMKAEKRFFHLGLDVIVPLYTPLHAPLDAVVETSGYEPGDGNFGGHVLLRHEGNFETFYSLYGHLNPEGLPQKGTEIKRGKSFALIGDFNQNGNWFYHTHLQILTERGYQEGYLEKGYCTAEMLPEIPYICPSPLHLFRY